MRWLPGWNNPYNSEQRRMIGELRSTSTERARKFWVALALYAVLALLVWFTMDAGKVPIYGRPVDLRLVPLVVIGALALRTILARKAERVRRDADAEDSEASREQIEGPI